MKILLISTSFNGLTQRFYTELIDAGFTTAVELHHGNHEQIIQQTNKFDPDLIICPFLTRRIPDEVWRRYQTLIVHPGIKGDRGPSSLDWAIQQGLKEWGVTILQADSEMDAGDIWSSKTFPVRENATKGSLYNREVTQTAIDCLWEALAFFESQCFKPEPLNYDAPDVHGKLQAMMKQADRKIDWINDSTNDIANKINAADGNPGVLDEAFGKSVFLHNVGIDLNLSGNAGEWLARAPNGALCRATKDGAVWIGHMKLRNQDGSKGIKLPSAYILKGTAADHLRQIDFDYTQAGKSLPCQETWYEIEGEIAYVYAAFHNGAKSTFQCQDFLQVYKHVATLPVKAIILHGHEDVWSNGIHLNHIEAADSPADESWLNINAINDIVYQILHTMDKITISAVSGNAGAGGAILALASDIVYARKGVIFNPHYKSMGKLYGSEYWSYLLPNRVGKDMTETLTNNCLPISANQAWKIGMIDKVLDKNHQLFYAQVRNLVQNKIEDPALWQQAIKQKVEKRCFDEAEKPLAAYRRHELVQIHHNFYMDDQYHQARKRFVLKQSCGKTPKNISIEQHLEHTGPLPSQSIITRKN